MATSKMVKIQSSDEEVFEVDIKVAQMSELITEMLENCAEDDDSPAPVQVSSAILKKVIEWADHHKDDISTGQEDDDEGKDKRDVEISQWDKDFMQVDQETLMGLVLAANYLDIEGLLNLTCKTIANIINTSTPEDVRQTFGIKNDFTKSELEETIKENAWCETKTD